MVLLSLWECLESYDQNINNARSPSDQSGAAGLGMVRLGRSCPPILSANDV